MPNSPDAPLMDNLQFLGELQPAPPAPAPKAQPRANQPAPSAQPRAVHRQTHETKAHARDAAEQARETSGPQFMVPDGLDAAPSLKTPPPGGASSLLAIVGFLVMMSIGAGAATVVFHERVALIVAQWSRR